MIKEKIKLFLQKMIIVFSFKTKVVHGDDSAYPNINTVYALFDVPNDEKNGFLMNEGMRRKAKKDHFYYFKRAII